MATDFEQRDNSGALFVNSRKTKESHPDRTGSLKAGGIEYSVSAWVKEGKNGKPNWLSMALTPKESRENDATQPDEDKPVPVQRAERPTRQFDQSGVDDDVPF